MFTHTIIDTLSGIFWKSNLVFEERGAIVPTTGNRVGSGPILRFPQALTIVSKVNVFVSSTEI